VTIANALQLEAARHRASYSRCFRQFCTAHKVTAFPLQFLIEILTSATPIC